MAAISYPKSIPYFKNSSNYPPTYLSLKGRTRCNKIGFPSLTKTLTLSKVHSAFLLPISKIPGDRVETSSLSLFGDSKCLKFSPKRCSFCGEEKKEKEKEKEGVVFKAGDHTIAKATFKDGRVEEAKYIDKIQAEEFQIDYLNTGVGLQIHHYPTPATCLPVNVGNPFSSRDLDSISVPGWVDIAHSCCLAETNEKKRFFVIDGSIAELIYRTLFDMYQHIEVVNPIRLSAYILGSDKKLPTSAMLAGLVVHDAHGIIIASTYLKMIPTYMAKEDGSVTDIRDGEIFARHIRLVIYLSRCA